MVDLDKIRREVAEDAVKVSQDRDDAKVDEIIKRKGILPQVKEQIAMARKERMQTVKMYLCDQCNTKIMDESKGFVVHGNICTANPDKVGGLIGNNFPPCEEGEKIDPQAIQKTVLCQVCFLKALGFDSKPTARSKADIDVSPVRRELEALLKGNR